MNSKLKQLARTLPLKHVIVPRLLAGLPLAGIGIMHLTGSAPMKPILEAAHIPLPGLNAVVAPIVEIIAGLLLLSGSLARVGAALAAVTMLVAIYSHVVADWADEPPIILSIVVLASSIYILWRGGGAWSVDAQLASRK